MKPSLRVVIGALLAGGCTIPGAGGKYADDGPTPLVMPAYPARRRPIFNDASKPPQPLPTEITDLPNGHSTKPDLSPPTIPTPPKFNRMTPLEPPANTTDAVPPPRQSPRP